LDLTLTLVWQGQGAILEKIAEKSPQVVAKALTPKNSVSRAVVVCTFGIYNLAKRSDQLDTTDGSEVFVAGLQTAHGAYSCSKESSKASAPLRNGPPSTLQATAMEALPEDTGLLRRIADTMEPHQKIIRLAKSGIIRIATKGKQG
jgi:hypothetical protein